MNTITNIWVLVGSIIFIVVFQNVDLFPAEQYRNNGNIKGYQYGTFNVSDIPFVVSLLLRNVFCQGSLIGPSHILASAACLQRAYGVIKCPTMNYTVKSVAYIAVNTAIHAYGLEYERRSGTYGLHDLYNKKSLDNGIALIRIEPPFTSALIPFLRYSKLSSAKTETPDTFAGRTADYLAFGQLSRKPYRDIFKAKVTILGSKECKVRFPGVITNNHICISTPDKQFCDDADFNDPTLGTQKLSFSNLGANLLVDGVQVGIQIHRGTCGDSGFAAIFLRVAAYSGWINKTIATLY